MSSRLRRVPCIGETPWAALLLGLLLSLPWPALGAERILPEQEMPPEAGPAAEGERVAGGNATAARIPPAEMEKLLPPLAGFVRSPQVRSYLPETLYEYIDGAAEGYLDYGFQHLVTADYTRAGKDALTVDLYLHAGAAEAFGIYSRERPGAGTRLDIGGEGCWSRGMLTFCKGPYYVKLMGFGLGEEEAALLAGAAGRIAGLIPGAAELPAPAHAFPSSGLVPGSLRFVARGFLGHGFLHSAWTADYEAPGGSFQLFLIDGAGEADAVRMLSAWSGLAREKGLEVTEGGGLTRFPDPYHRGRGLLHLRHRGQYVWGLFSERPEEAERVTGEMEGNLARLGLLP